MKISAALEQHQSQLEVISQINSELRKKYEAQEDFHRKWVTNKVDMERIGSIIDEKLNKLFKEQEFLSSKITGKKIN